jgi:hypothetical protein
VPSGAASRGAPRDRTRRRAGARTSSSGTSRPWARICCGAPTCRILRCWEGLVFFAFVLDAYSRMVVGWQLASHMRTTLVLDALRMALGTRRPGADVALVVVVGADDGIQAEAPAQAAATPPVPITRQEQHALDRHRLSHCFGDASCGWPGIRLQAHQAAAAALPNRHRVTGSATSNPATPSTAAGSRATRISRFGRSARSSPTTPTRFALVVPVLPRTGFGGGDRRAKVARVRRCRPGCAASQRKNSGSSSAPVSRTRASRSNWSTPRVGDRRSRLALAGRVVPERRRAARDRGAAAGSPLADALVAACEPLAGAVQTRGGRPGGTRARSDPAVPQSRRRTGPRARSP